MTIELIILLTVLLLRHLVVRFMRLNKKRIK